MRPVTCQTLFFFEIDGQYGVVWTLLSHVVGFVLNISQTHSVVKFVLQLATTTCKLSSHALYKTSVQTPACIRKKKLCEEAKERLALPRLRARCTMIEVIVVWLACSLAIVDLAIGQRSEFAGRY